MTRPPRLVPWPDIERALITIRWPEVDRIIAISRGGLVVGAWIAGRLNKPLDVIRVRLYDDGPNPKERSDEPAIEAPLPAIRSGERLLVVDDVSKTGRTLKTVARELSGAHLTTFVLFGQADLSLFPFEDCLVFPWTLKRVDSLNQ